MSERETRHLTVTVDGEKRDATWKRGVGVYVSGHDLGKDEEVFIEDEPHQVAEMRRMVMEGEPLTLIVRARNL